MLDYLTPHKSHTDACIKVRHCQGIGHADGIRERPCFRKQFKHALEVDSSFKLRVLSDGNVSGHALAGQSTAQLCTVQVVTQLTE